MNHVSLDHFFATLSNKQRVRILQLLADDGEQAVSAIAEALGAEQSAVSHNLKQLLTCHFVTYRAEGKERIYSINEDTVAPLLDLIYSHVKRYCVKGCDHWE
jgi:DNA-binding transcriptional ArsR family regulator